MEIAPQLFDAKVMHKRYFPRVNAFSYRIYYLAFAYAKLRELADGWRFGVNALGIMSFHSKDHFHPASLLEDYGITQADGVVVLVTMPRILGYGFNPLSLWLCLDKSQDLRAVVAEVHNTFGEHHRYLCAAEDQRIITAAMELEAQKIFHVSPFMQREGSYRFRFDYRPQENRLGVWIDYYHADGRLHLATSLLGKLIPYTRTTRRRMFWQVPLLSLQVIGLIHWQALKLTLKRIRYIPKPPQLPQHESATTNLTKWSSDGHQAVKPEEL